MDEKDRTVVDLTARRRAADREARRDRRASRPPRLDSVSRGLGLMLAAVFWLVLATGLAATIWRFVG